MAAAAGADPVEFRLRYLEDPRAKDVVKMTAESSAGIRDKLPKGRDAASPMRAIVILRAMWRSRTEVEIDADDRRGADSARRFGRAIAAKRSARTASATRSRAASCNPQAGRFTSRSASTRRASPAAIGAAIRSCVSPPMPESIEVHVIDRPGQPFLGAGEASQGPAARRIANAIAQATGARLRDLPLTRDKVKAAMGA